jgi:hypothetical protein
MRSKTRATAGHVTYFGQTALRHLGPEAAGLKKLPGVHAEEDVQRTSQLPDFSQIVAVLGLPVVG